MVVVAAAVAVVMRAAAAAVGLVLGAEKIVQDVDNRGDVPLGLPVAVLQRGVQCAGEGAGGGSGAAPSAMGSNSTL